MGSAFTSSFSAVDEKRANAKNEIEKVLLVSRGYKRRVFAEGRMSPELSNEMDAIC